MFALDKSAATALNRRLLKNLRDNTTDTAAKEMAVPASAYTCPERFAAERVRLFRRAPQPVAFSAEIATPGSYLTLDVMDVPVLLTRDEDGELRAFINACSHRGAQVATGGDVTGRLVCPFHGWAYDLRGNLAGRPGDAYFYTRGADCALTPLPISEPCGIVVLGLEPDMSPDRPAQALIEVSAELESFGFRKHLALERRQFEVQANWKLVNELSLESYHFRTLHRDSVAAVLDPNAVVDTWQRSSRWAFPLKSIIRLEGLDENQWPDAVEGSTTYTLYPGVMVIANASGAQMIRAEPGDTPETCRVIYSGIRKAESDPDASAQAYAFGGEVFEQEDLPVAEQCQRGLTARHRDLLLGRNEPLLQFWHRLWKEAVS